MNRRQIEMMLLIEDNLGDARLIQEMFQEQGPQNVELKHVECMEDAERFLAVSSVDVILLDLGLPDVQGLDAVRRARTAAPNIPLVVLSGLDDESMAVRAMQERAQDYLIKGQIKPSELVRALRYAVERKVIEETLFEEKERAQVTLDSIGDAVLCTDVSGDITYLNLAAEKMTGWSLREVSGRPMADAFRILNAKTGRAVPHLMVLDSEQQQAGNLPSHFVLVRRDGTELYIENSVASIHDQDGQVVGSVLVFRDESAAREMADQIARLAERDFLTGLPNRLLLNDRIGQAIALAQRNKAKIAVLLMDIDGFKQINDSLGYAAGDKVLQCVANRLGDCVRAPDTVSRQGGDEFIVLFQGVRVPEDAAFAARRLLKSLAETYFMGQHNLHITASIGVSLYPDDGTDADTLIRNADTAMYRAKEDGHQSYQFFKPEMTVRAVERQSIEGDLRCALGECGDPWNGSLWRQSIEEDLRCALGRNEFALHYQPKFNLATGAITGAEALLRWSHPIRGLVSPAQFIPIAEDFGLIVPIGAWVMREACTQAQAWIAAGLPMESIAVNVSAIEFRNEGFLDNLFAIIGETGLDPRHLQLEVTESVLMKNAELASTILQALRGKGVRVAIDDFGTGYSSLSYLQKLPLDALKIDQSFVRQIAAPPDGATIVAAIIGMARSLNLRVIAEGVETPEELAFLKTQQCDEAQGYRFSGPIPSKQFAALLKAERSHRKAQAKGLLGHGVADTEFLRPPSFTPEVENRRHFNLEKLRQIAGKEYSREVAL